MKPRCQHRFQIKGSVARNGKRVFTLECPGCGKVKTQKRKLPIPTNSYQIGSSAKKPRKRLPAVSQKRKELNKQYSEARRVFLEAHVTCQVEGCRELATDVHHRGRRGKNLLKTELFMVVCRQHHDYIERNGLWAKAQGYTIPYHLT